MTRSMIRLAPLCLIVVTLAMVSACSYSAPPASPGGSSHPTLPPTSAAHMPKLPYVHTVTQTEGFPVPSNISKPTGSLVATCPIGESVIGGGWSFPVPTQFVSTAKAPRVYKSDEYVDNGWRVAFSYSAPVTATAFAECLGNAAAQVSDNDRITDIASDEADQIATASCPDNTTLVGGGFANNSNDDHVVSVDFEVFGLSAVGNSWFVKLSTSAGTKDTHNALVVTAMCYGAVLPRTFNQQTQVHIPSQDGINSNYSAFILASCEDGWTLVAGGFATTDSSAVPLMNAPDLDDPSGRTWKALQWDNSGPNVRGFGAGAQCVQF